MVKPTYDDAPDAPSRSNPTTFRVRMDAFLAWMPGFKTFMDASNTHVDDQLTATGAARDKAEEWADKAEDSEVETGQFSAKHHAAKAGASASAASDSADAAAISESNAEGFKDSAQTAASAAGAAAGLPALAGNGGKFLRANDAEDGVEFDTVSVAMIPLSKHEVTSAVAAVEFTIPSGYASIIVVLDDINGDSDDTDLCLRTSSNGGSSFLSSDYSSGFDGVRYETDSLTTSENFGGAQFVLADRTEVPGAGQTGDINLYGLASGSQTRAVWATTGSRSGRPMVSTFGAGRRKISDLTDALQFRFSSGNVASGTIHVYGLVEGA